MSRYARVLLEQLQDIRPDIEFDIYAIEYYGNNYHPNLLAAYWKHKMNLCAGYGGTQEWYLPKINSGEHIELLNYLTRLKTKGTTPKTPKAENKYPDRSFPVDWDEKTKQIYDYLCNEVLEHDFNQKEFKLLLDIGMEFTISDVHQIIEQIKNNDDWRELPYIMAALRRYQQSKEIRQKTYDEGIARTQTWLDNIPKVKTPTMLELALMNAEFKEQQEIADVARKMEEVRHLHAHEWGLKGGMNKWDAERIIKLNHAKEDAARWNKKLGIE